MRYVGNGVKVERSPAAGVVVTGKIKIVPCAKFPGALSQFEWRLRNPRQPEGRSAGGARGRDGIDGVVSEKGGTPRRG